MTIYVDDTHQYSSGKWCHMWADDGQEEELHQFAEKIGLKRDYVQLHRGVITLLHYDLRPSKRVLAVKNGAKEVKARDYIREKMKLTTTQFTQQYYENP